MRKPSSVKSLEDFGRVRLSKTFFMRDFLFSEIAAIHAVANLPDDPELAIAAGTALCENLLEPLQQKFGRLAIRSAYRSPELNTFGNAHGFNCAQTEKNYAGHIWDRRDADGNMGATACIVVPSFIDYYDRTGDWQAIAWWVHDHLPYHDMQFFPRYAAFNLTWRQNPERRIHGFIAPRGILTRPGMDNHTGDHSAAYQHFLSELSI